jgi:predicted XRE-type DNA-binding protein
MKKLTRHADSRTDVKRFPASARLIWSPSGTRSRRMSKRGALEQEPGTGNVFADLGLADASEHLIKAGLVVRIDRIILERKLTQAAEAELMGIDQPKVSAMLAGQFRGYSVERLMHFLVALGHDVEIVVKPKRRPCRTSRRIKHNRRDRARRVFCLCRITFRKSVFVRGFPIGPR